MVTNGIPLLAAALVAGSIWFGELAPAQSPDPNRAGTTAAETVDIGEAMLEWTPPALTQLGTQAAAKESFMLDRTMLAAAAGMLPDADAEVKRSVTKLDGISLHILRFAAAGTADPAALEAIRQSYHLRGWKHVISEKEVGGPAHSGMTDVWVVLDGVNLRGAVVLVESPKSLTLATIAGNLSPVDVLHLRGHFGIPRFEGDGLRELGK